MCRGLSFWDLIKSPSVFSQVSARGQVWRPVEGEPWMLVPDLGRQDLTSLSVDSLFPLNLCYIQYLPQPPQSTRSKTSPKFVEQQKVLSKPVHPFLCFCTSPHGQ